MEAEKGALGEKEAHRSQTTTASKNCRYLFTSNCTILQISSTCCSSPSQSYQDQHPNDIAVPLIFSPFCHYNALSAVPETARDHLGQTFVQQAQRIPWPMRRDATALMLWRWYTVIVRQLLPKLKVTTNFIMAMACYDMLWMAMICKCRRYGEKSCGVCRWVYLCCADIER